MNLSSARQVALNASIAVLAGIAALALCEGALRWILPAPSRYYVLWPGFRAEFHPDPAVIPGVRGSAAYSVNADGLRARPFGQPDEEYRILAVGGSTTECPYLDDAETWPSLLETMLPRTGDGRLPWVGSVGRSGLNARDHVVEAKYLLPQYPSIDAVVVLVGINDLTVALAQGDDYARPPPIHQPEAEQRQIRRAFAITPGPLHRPQTEMLMASGAPWYKGTALYQLAKRVRYAVAARLNTSDLIQDDSGRSYEAWRERRRNAPQYRDNLPDLGAALAEYAATLNAMIDIAEARDVHMVLVTQPTLWHAGLSPTASNRLWLGGVGRFQQEQAETYFTVRALSEAMARFNATLLDVCESRELECLDLANRVPRDTSVFYDDAHFTELGARTVARELARFLARRSPFDGVVRATGGRRSY
jgi:lysophospholipase L1-like esterase